MKILISPSGAAGIRVSVQRTARHTRTEAYELGKELAAELATTAETWTFDGPTRTPRPPKNALPTWAPRGLFTLRLPVIIKEVSPGYRVNEPLVTDPAERQRLVEVVEEVAGQYAEKVDALNMVRWIMEPRFGYACPNGARLGASAKDRSEYESIATEREAWRLELLAPYIAGKHPVRHTELFAEFQTEFDILERAVIRAVAWGDTNMQYIRYSIAQENVSDAKLRPEWHRIANLLLKRQWAIERPVPNKIAPSMGPFIGRGLKSALLPSDQLRAS